MPFLFLKLSASVIKFIISSKDDFCGQIAVLKPFRIFKPAYWLPIIMFFRSFAENIVTLLTF